MTLVVKPLFVVGFVWSFFFERFFRVCLTSFFHFFQERAERYYTSSKTNHQLIREYIDLFGFMSKNPNAMDIMIEEARAILRIWGADEPNFLLCNSKLTFQMTMIPEKTQYLTQGPDGMRKLRAGPDISTYRGLKIINTRAFSMDEGAPPRDVLRRRVRVAEYYRIPYEEDIHTKTFAFYDESKDAWQNFTWHDLYKMARKPKGFGYDGYGEEMDDGDDEDHGSAKSWVIGIPGFPPGSPATFVEISAPMNAALLQIQREGNVGMDTMYWEVLAGIIRDPDGGVTFEDAIGAKGGSVLAGNDVPKKVAMLNQVVSVLTGMKDFYQLAESGTVNSMATIGGIGIKNANSDLFRAWRDHLMFRPASSNRLKMFWDQFDWNLETIISHVEIFIEIMQPGASRDDIAGSIKSLNRDPYKPPVELVVIRPNIEHNMLGIIMGRGGLDELGATFWGQTELSCYDDSMHGIWGMSYKYNEKAIVTNHKNLIRLWDIAYDGYNGGKDCTHVQWTDPDSVAKFKEDTYEINKPYEGSSMMVMAFDNVEDKEPWPSPIVFHDPRECLLSFFHHLYHLP